MARVFDLISIASLIATFIFSGIEPFAHMGKWLLASTGVLEWYGLSVGAIFTLCIITAVSTYVVYFVRSGVLPETAAIAVAVIAVSACRLAMVLAQVFVSDAARAVGIVVSLTLPLMTALVLVVPVLLRTPDSRYRWRSVLVLACAVLPTALYVGSYFQMFRMLIQSHDVVIIL